MLMKDVPEPRQKKQGIPVDEIKEGGEIEIKVKLTNKIRLLWQRKKALIGACVLATGLIIAGQWGTVLQIIGSSLVGLEGLHEIGRQSKYGEKGEFKREDLINALKDLLEALIKVIKLILSRPKM